jgi:hypothetical protein
MLTPSQRNDIMQNGLSTLHDYWTESLISGEPFFEDDVLIYYDGRMVSLCSFPLRGRKPVEAAVIKDLSRRWVVDNQAEALIYWGPEKMDFRHLKKYGFRCTEGYAGGEQAAELFINCAEAAAAVHHLRSYRLAVRCGFTAEFRTGGIVPADYFKLIEAFFRKAGVSDYLATMAFVLPALLRSGDVHLVEARLEGKLCGFSTLHKPFSDIAVGLFLAHDAQTPHVSDFLYGQTIIYAEQLGIKLLNVGSSPSVGHYNFKRKWGAEPLVPPFYYSIWARGQLARRKYMYWGPRIVKL